MEEMNNINPLMDFARKVECSVKIPSQGLWYDDDNIAFNAIGEVDIMPMLPNDEMNLVNPETLVSGDSIISVIKSCCPGIKRPEELYYPDINVLLLGIRKATYGNKMEQDFICPNCWEKKTKIEEEEILKNIQEYKKKNNIETISEEKYVEIRNESLKAVEHKITEMERNNEIIIQPQKTEFEVDNILNKMTFLPSSAIVDINGLQIYVTPYTFEDKILFANREIKNRKILQYYEKNKRKLDDDNTIDEEYLNILKGIKDRYLDLSNLTVDIIVSCIKKIQLPNGEVVTNRDFILEFIKNSSSEITNKIFEKIDELNKCGIQSTIPVTCPCCNHSWDEKFYGFNQSDFFGIGS